MSHSTLSLAVGPVMPGWGSWEWVGAFLVEQLHRSFHVSTFPPGLVPDADIVVIVKHAPSPGWVEEVSRRSALVYCPIDWYGDARDIEADSVWLRKCDRIVVHCHRLKPYFAPFAETTYLDHPLKFATSTRRSTRTEGSLLWVGVRSNLASLVAWVNAHSLPLPLDILTNPEQPGRVPSATDLGFVKDRAVRVQEWSAERHLELTGSARAALDVKGEEFRSRHKPPAKALDFVCSGVPLALNPGSSPAEHLANLGLVVPSPLDTDRWLSESYAKEVRRVGDRLSRELSPSRVAGRFLKLLQSLRPRGPVAATRTDSETPNPAAPEVASLVLPGNSVEPEVMLPAQPDDRVEASYRDALQLAVSGDPATAAEALRAQEGPQTPPRLRALIRNDLATLAALGGDLASAKAGFQAALDLDPNCQPARLNLETLVARHREEAPKAAPAPASQTPPVPTGNRVVRVAVVSLLFNWPSTGGGNVHSAELTKFLAAVGYDVKHLYAKFEDWGIGRVIEPTPYPTEAVEFSREQWNTAEIINRFRNAIDAFDADWVILTDSWNLKPVLAAAAGNRPYILRLQALECLCPLNNVRLLPMAGGPPHQCRKHQLATPDDCARCVRDLDHTSGDLHRAERALAGVGTREYKEVLFRAFADAACVLAVNALTAAMVEPFARDVRVVTAGMDPARFPHPFPPDREVAATPGRLRLLFAGLTHEWMKGFHVLREACRRLWLQRQDFEVIATDTPPGPQQEPWVRYVGWQSQDQLPAYMASADIVVVPTVAQEALGRTAVEAMAAAKPVVASRLGGLPFTVIDGATGLLSNPSDAADLAAKLSRLMSDAELRQRLGEAGRQRFEEHYAWPAIIERHYRPLLGPPTRPLVTNTAGRSQKNDPSVLVVVSYYAGRPIDSLMRLLDSMAAFPAGVSHDIQVVVNRDHAETITLPDRHCQAKILYRQNAGYNIGAWEAGWRANSQYDAYLFVQDECRVIRSGWIRAFVNAASEPRVGLVGECESPDWAAPWEILRERFRGHRLHDHDVMGTSAERVDCYLDFFRRRGIPPGAGGDHLQSLVLFATRLVLERVGGFPEGGSYGEAIAAEIGMSKKVQAVGLTLRRVGPEPFHFIEHPQWLHRRTQHHQFARS